MYQCDEKYMKRHTVDKHVNWIRFWSILRIEDPHWTYPYALPQTLSAEISNFETLPPQDWLGPCRPPWFAQNSKEITVTVTHDFTVVVLYWTWLYFTVLYCTRLYFILPHWTGLNFDVLYCTLMYLIVLVCTFLYFIVRCCTLLYHVALYCTWLHLIVLTVHWCTLLYFIVLFGTQNFRGADPHHTHHHFNATFGTAYHLNDPSHF